MGGGAEGPGQAGHVRPGVRAIRRQCDLARQAGDATLAAKATANAALSAARGGQAEKANELAAARSLSDVRDLPDSLDKANLLVTVGQADQLLLTSKAPGVDAGRVQRRAFDAYEQARQIAAQMNNPLAGSYAVGYQGRLYEEAKRYDEALTLTRRAVLLAQQAQSPDSLYLWQWQTGRIFKARASSRTRSPRTRGARHARSRPQRPGARLRQPRHAGDVPQRGRARCTTSWPTCCSPAPTRRATRCGCSSTCPTRGTPSSASASASWRATSRTPASTRRRPRRSTSRASSARSRAATRPSST